MLLANQNTEYCISFKAGRYEVRFARTQTEVAAAQALRYNVLYIENHGNPSEDMSNSQREIDQWDDIADHVIVIDHKTTNHTVVGTLRLVSQSQLKPDQDFYTAHAFNLSKLYDSYKNIVEVSRFCIDSKGRGGSILMLIWKFTMQFISDKQYDLLLGCASFLGADLKQHKAALSYLYQHNLAPPHLQPRPVLDNYIEISSFQKVNPDWKDVKKSIPTLLRGYLKIGAKISDCVIIDPVFNTVFVTIYIDVKKMIAENHTLAYTNGTE